jgi:hypothetical protein
MVNCFRASISLRCYNCSKSYENVSRYGYPGHPGWRGSPFQTLFEGLPAKIQNDKRRSKLLVYTFCSRQIDCEVVPTEESLVAPLFPQLIITPFPGLTPKAEVRPCDALPNVLLVEDRWRFANRVALAVQMPRCIRTRCQAIPPQSVSRESESPDWMSACRKFN